MDSSTSTTMPEELTITDKVIKEYGRAVVSLEIAFHINEALQNSYKPHLKNELCVYERLHGDLKKYGDYICKNILCVCELLRSKDPDLFKKTTPHNIAKDIIKNFPKSNMLEELNVRDVGFLTFKLNGDWMAERIGKHLKDGIDEWAPLPPVETVIVDFPFRDRYKYDVRSKYIRDMLVCMLKYCGVEVQDIRNPVSRKLREWMMLGMTETKASILNDEALIVDDLRWGTKVQKAQWIIYVTHVWHREFMIECFTAAKEFVNKDQTTMCYLGYQTSGDERRKLSLLWNAFESSYKKNLCDVYVERGMAPGYSAEALFECAIKFTYLKTQTYSYCTFDIQEMLDDKRDTFLYLLNTRDKIRKIHKHSHPNVTSNKALVGSERELGLQLLQFTEIIQESILSVMPHWLCEYLLNLSKNFTSYIHEVGPDEINFLLCKATEIVMEKCFDLLGISPEFSEYIQSYEDVESSSFAGMTIRDWPHSSPNPTTSRFELFSMFIEITHSNFTKGNLFGKITVSDMCGLRSDAWCDVDENGCGRVAYFDHDWYDSVEINDSSLLSFDDSASRHSVALSSLSIEIGVELWVTSKEIEKEKDKCYQLCVAKDEIKLAGFLSGTQSIELSTFSVEGTNGSVSIYYSLLKDAVDTSMRLEYEPINSFPKVYGHILAYYGGDALKSCDGFNKHTYMAVIFQMEPTKLEEKSVLPLKKSALAVPTKGILMFKAEFRDADSGEILLEGTSEYHEKDEGTYSEWIIGGIGQQCRFTLTVDWIRAVEGCS